jgi:hypothetical protein
MFYKSLQAFHGLDLRILGWVGSLPYLLSIFFANHPWKVDKFNCFDEQWLFFVVWAQFSPWLWLLVLIITEKTLQTCLYFKVISSCISINS